MYIRENKHHNLRKLHKFFDESPVTISLIIFMISISFLRYIVYFLVRIDINAVFSLVPSRVIEEGAFWILLTNIFLHDDLVRNPFHLIANMIALFYIGRYVERMLGKKQYLSAFILTGLGGSICIVLSNWLFMYLNYSTNYDSHYLGASGVILGIFSILALYRPKIRIIFFLFIPPYLIIPILAPLKLMLIIQFTLDLLLGILNLPFDYIAHFGHVGGMITGFILYKLHLRKKLYEYTYGYVWT